MTIFTDTIFVVKDKREKSLRTALNCGKFTKVCFAFTIKSQLALTDIYSSIQIMDHKLKQKEKEKERDAAEK